MFHFRSILLGILSLALTSCVIVHESGSTHELKHAAPVSLTAHMALRVLKGNAGEQQRIGIVILNPGEVPLQSVRAWVRFPHDVLTVRDLVIEDGRFVLFAPGERAIDREQGLIKLGAAVTAPVRDREILVASFTVRERTRIAGERPVLTFYDWRAEGEGHAAVLSVQDSVVRNVLQAPPSLAL